ncbi:MAG: dihydroorotate dehydrogenase electron transfer subunit [Candidatus Marinimicrobia bacterium]|nr:dihydroorotate dehydrogenase electron transfer subunit [Candidatus Neomarinimicrobiota bacterium]
MRIEIASVLENKLIARNIWKMKMTAPGVAEQYKGAGQFIQILVESSWANPLRRPMSISAVEGGKIEIIYKVFGEMTQLLSEKGAGEELDILGPLGNTFKLHDDGSTPVLVGGGVGLAPIINMYGEFNLLGKDAFLIIGARTGAEHFIEHEPHNNVLLTTDDGSIGIPGTVIPAIEKSLEKTTNPAIFACGPELMLKAVQEFAAAHAMPAQLSVESYMGCGIGICQGCVVERVNGSVTKHSYHEKYSLVCIDGPVYQSEEVIIG